MMADKQPQMAQGVYQTTPQQQDLDSKIRDLTVQLAEVRAEAANYQRTRSQQELQQSQPPTYQEEDLNNSNYVTSAPVATSSREVAPAPAPSSSMPDAPPPPYSNSTDHIPLPIVLPQVGKNYRGAFFSPFVRAYVPELEAHDISQSDFLTFIDGLNEAFIANPVFQGVGVAGMIMQQFYGLQPVQWAGIGVQVASGVASAATSYARTKAYVKAVNANLFHPVGLHVNIMTTKKMMAKVGHPEERLSLPPMDTTDQLETNSSTLSQQSSNSSSSLSPRSSNISTSSTGEDARVRRVRALQGYVMPLDFDVPSAVTPDNVLKRMGAAQARRQARRQQKKDDKRLDKAFEKVDKADDKIANIEKHLSKERRKMERDLGKSKATRDPKEKRKVEREFEKKERELGRKMEKALEKRDKKVGKHGDREGALPAKFEKREEKTANKIRWVVISTWEGDADEEENSEDSNSMEEEEDEEEGEKSK